MSTTSNKGNRFDATSHIRNRIISHPEEFVQGIDYNMLVKKALEQPPGEPLVVRHMHFHHIQEPPKIKPVLMADPILLLNRRIELNRAVVASQEKMGPEHATALMASRAKRSALYNQASNALYSRELKEATKEVSKADPLLDLDSRIELKKGEVALLEKLCLAHTATLESARVALAALQNDASNAPYAPERKEATVAKKRKRTWGFLGP